MALTLNPISSGDSNDTSFIAQNTTAADARNATASTSANKTGSTGFLAGHLTLFGTTYNYRFILAWDLSGYSGTVTGADFKAYGGAEVTSGFATYKDPILYMCKTDLTSSNFSTSTYNEIDNWPSSGSYDGTVDNYGSGARGSSSAGYNTLTLNSDGLSDINSAVGSGLFSMMIMTDDDYLSDISASGIGGNAGYGGFLSFYGLVYNTANNTANKPELVLDGDGDFGAVAAAPSVNSVFFGANF